MFSANCSNEINKSFFYDHFKPKEHRDIEVYCIRKRMSYHDKCNKEKK